MPKLNECDLEEPTVGIYRHAADLLWSGFCCFNTIFPTAKQLDEQTHASWSSALKELGYAREDARDITTDIPLLRMVRGKDSYNFVLTGI